MKKYLTILAAAVALTACNSTSYTITGNLPEDLGAETIYLYTSNLGEVVDSCTVTEGQFSFKGDAEIPSIAYLVNNADVRLADFRAMFFLEPGDIRFVSEENDICAEGTPSNDANNAFVKEEESIIGDIDEQNATPEQIQALEDALIELVKAAIKDNSDNLFGLYTLFQYDSAVSTLEETYEFLLACPESLKNTKLYESYFNYVEKAVTIKGGDYIDFEQASIVDGEMVSLSSVVNNPENKYVLLDFWASWCSPCMGEVPYMLRAYAEYHGKGFEIFGSSLDRSEESWKNAVKSNSMDWVHVSDLQYWQNAGAQAYGVNSIPANFLIDCATGKIIDSNLRGENLAAKLAELLD